MPKRESNHGDTLAADEHAAGKRQEADLNRYHEAAPGKTSQKKAEGDIAKDMLTGGDKLTKGRPQTDRRR